MMILKKLILHCNLPLHIFQDYYPQRLNPWKKYRQHLNFKDILPLIDASLAAMLKSVRQL